MNTIESVLDGRDHVASTIEKYLRAVERDGVHKLTVKPRSDCIRVHFAGETAKGDTVDIALIRLAAILLDRDAFREELTKRLRGPYAIFKVQDVCARRQLRPE